MNSSNGINPFPGIRPFDVKEKYLFFGREDQTAELLTRLRKTRFLAVVGSSGSGKSSLVRAGLIPELHGGTMAAAGSAWEVAVMKPGGDPLTNLAKSLVDADLYDPDQEDVVSMIRASLSRSGMGLVDTIQQSDLESKTNLLIVVDQFEEIFRFRRMTGISEEEAGHFIRLLLEASQDESCPIYVVLTMRSDFLGDCAQFGDLAEAVNEGEYIIPRLNRNQRKQAIEAPSRVGGREMSNRLVQRLLNDISDDPDQLPILQHALMRTWEYWVQAGSKGPVDLEHYQATGGMTEALSRHADEVFQSLPDGEHRRIATLIFKSLTEKVSENRGIRRPMQLNELHEICGGDIKQLLHVIDEFRKTGCTFLMPAGESELQKHTIIDISHESLMRVWRTLRLWVDDEAQSAKIYRRLADTASLFKDGKAGLYRHPDLGIALAWRDENQPNQTWADRYYPGFAEAMAFLDKSQAEEEREGREKEEAQKRELAQAQALAKAKERTARIFKAACVGVTVLAVLCLYAFVQATKSEKIAKASLTKQAKRSEQRAEEFIKNNEHQKGIIWLLDAYKLSSHDATLRDSLQNRFSEIHNITPKIKRVIQLKGESVLSEIGHDKYYSISGEGTGESYYKGSFDSISIDIENNYSNIGIGRKKQLVYGTKGDKLTINFLNPIEKESHFKHSCIKEADQICIKEKTGEVAILNKGILYIFKDSEANPLIHKNDELAGINYSNDENLLVGVSLTKGIIYNYNIQGNVRSETAIELSVLNDASINYITFNENRSQCAFVTTTATGGETTIHKYGQNSKNPTYKLKISEGNIRKIKALDNGNGYFILNDNSQLIFVDLINEKETYFKSDLSPYAYFELSNDGLHSCIAHEDNSISVINNYTGKTLYRGLKYTFGSPVISFIENGLGLLIEDTQNNQLIIVSLPVFKKNLDATFPDRNTTISTLIESGEQEQYSQYIIGFPKIRGDAENSNSVGVQIAEIELFDPKGKRLNVIQSEAEGESPKGEAAAAAFDSTTTTKYFNFQPEDSAITITLDKPSSIKSINFTSANDAPGRDPIEFYLAGIIDSNHHKTLHTSPIMEESYIKSKINFKNFLKDTKQSEIESYLSSVTFAYLADNGEVKLTLDGAHNDGLKQSNILKFSDGYYAHWHSRCYSQLYINNSFYESSKRAQKLVSLLETNIPARRKLGVSYMLSGELNKAEPILKNLFEIGLEDKVNYFSLLSMSENSDELAALLNKHLTSEDYGNNSFWDTQVTTLALTSDVKLSSESLKSLPPSVKNLGKIGDSEAERSYFQPSNSARNHLTDNSFTIESWIKFSDSKSQGFVFNKGGDGPSGEDGFTLFQVTSDILRFEYRNNLYSDRKQFDVQVPSDGWFHYAATWKKDTGKFSVYINGIPTQNSFFMQFPLPNTTVNFTFGNTSLAHGNMGAWDGFIGETRIWSYCSPPKIIKDRFMRRASKDEFGLAEIWRMDALPKSPAVISDVNLVTDPLYPLGENESYFKFNATRTSESYNFYINSLGYTLQNSNYEEIKLKLPRIIENANRTQNPVILLLTSLIAQKAQNNAAARKFYGKAIPLLGIGSDLVSMSDHQWRQRVFTNSLLRQCSSQKIK